MKVAFFVDFCQKMTKKVPWKLRVYLNFQGASWDKLLERGYIPERYIPYIRYFYVYTFFLSPPQSRLFYDKTGGRSKKY